MTMEVDVKVVLMEFARTLQDKELTIPGEKELDEYTKKIFEAVDLTPHEPVLKPVKGISHGVIIGGVMS